MRRMQASNRHWIFVKEEILGPLNDQLAVRHGAEYQFEVPEGHRATGKQAASGPCEARYRKDQDCYTRTRPRHLGRDREALKIERVS